MPADSDGSISKSASLAPVSKSANSNMRVFVLFLKLLDILKRYSRNLLQFGRDAPKLTGVVERANWSIYEVVVPVITGEIPGNWLPSQKSRIKF